MVRHEFPERLELLAALLCATASLTVPLLPHHPLASAAAVVAPVLLLAAVALRRRFLWLAVGAALMAAGDVVFRLLWWAHGAPVVPSVADLGFVLGYLALSRAAHLAAGPASGRRHGAALDALIVVVGPAAVVAAAVHDPLARAGAALETAQALVAPVFDLVLLVLVVRASVAGALTRWQAAGLQAAVVLLLLGNAGYLVLVELAPEVLRPWLGAPFGLAFSLAVLAVLAHRTGGPPGVGTGRTTTGSRLVLALLPLSACLPAAALLAQGVLGLDVDWPVLGSGALVAAALSTARLLGVMRTAAAQEEELERLVMVDDLTGLPNRRACTAALDAHVVDDGEPVALALLDLDLFKSVNDAHGHAAGDALLRAAARSWGAALPPTAGLHRWGGEEFVVLLRGEDALRAAEVLEDVRRATPAPHTVSAGLVARRRGEGAEALLARADVLLYRAKGTGRDRVCVDTDHLATDRDGAADAPVRGATAAPEVTGVS